MDGSVVSAKQYVHEQFSNILGTLIIEKSKEENKPFAREIAVTITETEKAFAYFVQYVVPHLED